MRNLTIILGFALLAGCTSYDPARPPDDDGEEPPPPVLPSLKFERPKDDGTLTPRMAGNPGTPLRIRVVNSSANNAPVAGIFIKWEAVTSGTSVSTELVATDAFGYSTTNFRVGTRAGSSVATATLDNIVEAFFVQVIPSFPAFLIGGGDDTTTVNTPDEWCIAEVRDSYDNVIPHVFIDWTLAGDATPPSATVETNSSGESWFFFDTGSIPGEVTATGQIQGTPQIPAISCRYTVL